MHACLGTRNEPLCVSLHNPPNLAPRCAPGAGTLLLVTRSVSSAVGMGTPGSAGSIMPGLPTVAMHRLPPPASRLAPRASRLAPSAPRLPPPGPRLPGAPGALAAARSCREWARPFSSRYPLPFTLSTHRIPSYPIFWVCITKPRACAGSLAFGRSKPPKICCSSAWDRSEQLIRGSWAALAPEDRSLRCRDLCVGAGLGNRTSGMPLENP
jgi:hypothetical protein